MNGFLAYGLWGFVIKFGGDGRKNPRAGATHSPIRAFRGAGRKRSTACGSGEICAGIKVIMKVAA